MSRLTDALDRPSAGELRYEELAVPEPEQDAGSYPWRTGTTQPPGFTDPEIMDGCRKAPIMTIGNNPNLTADTNRPKATVGRAR